MSFARVSEYQSSELRSRRPRRGVRIVVVGVERLWRSQCAAMQADREGSGRRGPPGWGSEPVRFDPVDLGVERDGLRAALPAGMTLQSGHIVLNVRGLMKVAT